MAGQHCEACGDGAGLRLGGHDQRPKQVVPVAHEVEHAHGEDCWHGVRQNDLREDAEFACAVDAGRVVEVLRNGDEELTQQEDAADVGHTRDDDAPVAVDEAHVGEQLVHRDEQGHARDHHGGDQHAEQQATALEIHAGQAVGGQGVEEHGDDGHGTGEDDGIEHFSTDWQTFEQRLVVLKGELVRDELWRPSLRDGVRGERHQHDNQQREDHQDGDEDQSEVAEAQADAALAGRLLAKTLVFGVDAGILLLLCGKSRGAHAISSFSCLLLVYSWMRPTMSVMISSTYDSADA